jgi:acetylornithine/succinyldiaminopimelate/putrescine aminotransferase
VLSVMERCDVPALAEARGRYLSAALENLPGVREVRGVGLLLAAELVEGKGAAQVASAALEAGLVVNAVTPSALRLAPSLLVSEAEIDEAVAILGKVLDQS